MPQTRGQANNQSSSASKPTSAKKCSSASQLCSVSSLSSDGSAATTSKKRKLSAERAASVTLSAAELQDFLEFKKAKTKQDSKKLNKDKLKAQKQEQVKGMCNSSFYEVLILLCSCSSS